MLECPPSPSRSMIDDTGPTHHAPSTGVTSYYRQRRREANLPKPDEREVLRRVNDLHHRNELTEVETLALTPMGLPVVAAELADGRWVELLGRDALDACDGDVDTFARVLRAAVVDHAA